MKRLLSLLVVLTLIVAVLPTFPASAQDDPIMKRLVEYNNNLPKGYGLISVDELNVLLVEKKPIVLLDVREPAEFEAGHIAGSIHIPIRELAKNLNLLPDLNAEIIVVCKGGARAALGMAGLQILGYKNVKTLKGGFDAWVGEDLPVTKEVVAQTPGTAPAVDETLLKALDGVLSALNKGFDLIAPKDFAAELAESAPLLIDLRTDAEWSKGYIDGAQHIAIEVLMANVDKLPADKSAKIVVYCGSGYRGGMAKIMLGMMGYTNVHNIAGGLNGWSKAGLPLVGVPVAAFDFDAYATEYLKALPDTFGAMRVPDVAKELEVANNGITLVDVRTADEYMEGHIAGAINIPLNDLTKNLNLLPNLDANIIIYCGSGHRSAVAMSALQLLGYKKVRSMLSGTTAWKAANLPLTEEAVTVEAGKAPDFNPDLFKLVDAYITNIPKGYNVVKPADLNIALAEQKPVLIDVRGEGEIAKGYIEGATFIGLRDLISKANQLPTDKAAPIYLYDNPTHRSSIAMVLLGLRGYTNVKVLGGGFGAWEKAGLPVKK